MKRIITIFLSLSLGLFAMSYEQFKKYTEKNAKALQSQALSLQTTQEENKILLRTQNPTLELEASRFNPNIIESDFGYSVIVSQTVRTGNYYGGLEDQATASALLQQAYVHDGKAGYFRTLENLYTEYVYQSKLLALLKEEYTLSNKMTDMVHERYKSGSENRVAYLQAKTDTMTLKAQMYTTKNEMHRLYYQLLAIAGLSKKVSLEKNFIYSVSTQTNSVLKTSPKEQILEAKEKLLESKIRLNESSINSYELYGGIEDEPEQSILRVGVSIPLPIWNDKSEEKTLAKLQMQQLSLDKEQLSIDLNSQKEMIKASIQELSKQYHSLKNLKKEQQILNDMLQEGYKIAQGSVFVMMNAKNKLIQTQKSLLQTQKNINNQKTELRFIQGQYND